MWSCHPPPSLRSARPSFLQTTNLSGQELSPENCIGPGAARWASCRKEGEAGARASPPRAQRPSLSLQGWSELSIRARSCCEPSESPLVGLPGGPVAGSPLCNAGDTGSIPGLGGSHVRHHHWACAPEPGHGSYCSPRAASLRSATGEPSAPSSPLLFSRSVTFTSERPRGLQHAVLHHPPSLLRLTESIESVMPLHHLTLCRPLLLPPAIFPGIRVFSSKSALASGGQRTRPRATPACCY